MSTETRQKYVSYFGWGQERLCGSDKILDRLIYYPRSQVPTFTLYAEVGSDVPLPQDVLISYFIGSLQDTSTEK